MGVTKSYVALSIKTDATNLDRQAGFYGYLGVLGSVDQVVFDKLNQPGFASIARNLGGGAALAGIFTRNQRRQVFEALRELTALPEAAPQQPIGLVRPKDSKGPTGKL